jgi:hypothetical protein
LTVTPSPETGSSKKIVSKKMFAGIGSVHVHVAFQAIPFRPDSSVSGLVSGYEVALQTELSCRLLQEPGIGRAVWIMADDAALLLDGIIVHPLVLKRKGPFRLRVAAVTFFIW